MTTLPTMSAEGVESDRLVLRKAQDADREGLIEIFTDPEVRAYLGGPRPREDVERFLDSVGTVNTTALPGSYVIADRQTDRLVGILGLGRRPADHPGHVTPEGGSWSCPTCCGGTRGGQGWRSRPPRPRCVSPQGNCPTNLSWS
jgi:RimJ/RimL family protein N-acetyltransferase